MGVILIHLRINRVLCNFINNKKLKSFRIINFLYQQNNLTNLFY